MAFGFKLGLGLSQRGGASAAFSVAFTGLTDGEARIGDHASIGYTTDPVSATETVKWSNSSDPAAAATYGTGANPTDYTAGDEGSLWLHVTDTIEGDSVTVSRSAPIRYAPGTAPAIADGQTFTVDTAITAIDASASGANLTFTYTLSGAPAGLSINSGTGSITGTPTAASSGTATITATDQYGRTLQDTFTFTASLRTQATGGTDLDLSFVEDSAITSTDLIANWTDNGNTLTFVSVSPALPAGLSISSAGAMTGTPTTVTADATYTLTMEDEYGRETSDTFTLEIVSFAAPDVWANMADGSRPFQTGTTVVAPVMENDWWAFLTFDGGTASGLQRFVFAGSQDTHHRPSALVRASDSRIVAAAPKTHNNTDYFVSISTAANDITTLAANTNIASQLGEVSTGLRNYAYADIHQLEGETDDPLYLFMRAGSAAANNWWRYYSKSTDGGTTWSALAALVKSGSGAKRPYMTSHKTSSTRIDFAVINDNPGSTTTNLYHFYLDAGTFRDTAGTALTLPIDLEADLTPIYTGTTGARAWLGQIETDGSGNPCIAYMTVTESVVPVDLKTIRHDGTSWTDTKVADGGTIEAKNIVFDPLDVDTVWAVVDDGSDKGQIHRFTTHNGGETYTDQGAITATVGADNLRIHVVPWATQPRMFKLEGTRGSSFSDTELPLTMLDISLTASAVPEAFVSGDWELAANGDVTITTLPKDNGGPISDVEYEVNASGTWVSTGGTADFNIPSLSGGDDVRLRAVNSQGAGAASDTKEISSFTPSSLYAASETGFYCHVLPANCYTDAGKTTNATVDDDTQVIADISGNATDLSAIDPTGRPPLKQDASSNYYLQFNGSSDGLISGAFAPASSTGWSVCMAVSVVNASSSTAQRIIDGDISSSGQRIGQFLRVQSGNAQAISFNGGSAFQDNGGAVANSTNVVLTVVADASGVEVFVNGASAGETSVTGAFNTNSQAVTVGCTADESSKFRIDAYGFMSINRPLTAQERSDVEADMAALAGVTL